MAKKAAVNREGRHVAEPNMGTAARRPSPKPSALLDTRVVYCGDNLEQLAKLPDACVDLIYIDPPFNSNSNYEVFWGETKEKCAFEDRHENTKAYIDYMGLENDRGRGRGGDGHPRTPANCLFLYTCPAATVPEGE